MWAGIVVHEALVDVHVVEANLSDQAEQRVIDLILAGAKRVLASFYTETNAVVAMAEIGADVDVRILGEFKIVLRPYKRDHIDTFAGVGWHLTGIPLALRTDLHEHAPDKTMVIFDRRAVDLDPRVDSA